MKRNDFSLQHLNEHDIPQLILLSASVGWDYDESEIKTIMSVGSVYGHRATTGDIAACAAIIPYGRDLASLGMVIVHPNYRRLGLGQAVTMRCIRSLPSSIPIMLIATPEGKPMYERLGFKSVDCVHKFLCDSYHPPKDAVFGEYSCLHFEQDHLPEIIKLDRGACGADRTEFIRERLKQAKKAILVKNHHGNIVGYALTIQGIDNLLIGPVVATDCKVASYLFDMLITRNEGRIRIDIPSGQPEFSAVLVQCGFEMVSQPRIMLLNSNELPQRNGTLFGIAAQVFG